MVKHRRVDDVDVRYEALPEAENTMLVFGNGRSYGDVCLNADGTLLRTRRMNHFIDFDRATGRLVCESGVLLKDILDLVIPQGWFLPVTPGTRYVTLGGAIANDVHGKNHHVRGSFGHHVLRLELLRSTGERMVCAPAEQSEWFHATVGGLGLTGMIVWAELQLMPVSSAFMVTESKKFGSLDDFWALNADAESRWPYTVAWIDCIASGKSQGRGIFMLGRHAPAQSQFPAWRESTKHFPIESPVSLVNSLSLRAFNFMYYHRPLPKGTGLSHYVPYFYPLDGVREWNRMYGRKGFFQYQCVLPPEFSRDGISELLRRIGINGQGSFLAVLKTFGAKPSLGILSFPRPGTTLALDFPNLGEPTHRLFRELDAVVREAGGALYPAKDARMPPDMFRAGYPLWEKFSAYVDPGFSSSFWRRVTS